MNDELIKTAQKAYIRTYAHVRAKVTNLPYRRRRASQRFLSATNPWNRAMQSDCSEYDAPTVFFSVKPAYSLHRAAPGCRHSASGDARPPRWPSGQAARLESGRLEFDSCSRCGSFSRSGQTSDYTTGTPTVNTAKSWQCRQKVLNGVYPYLFLAVQLVFRSHSTTAGCCQ